MHVTKVMHVTNVMHVKKVMHVTNVMHVTKVMHVTNVTHVKKVMHVGAINPNPSKMSLKTLLEKSANARHVIHHACRRRLTGITVDSNTIGITTLFRAKCLRWQPAFR